MIGVGSYRPDIAESNGAVARRACNVLLKKDEAGLSHAPMPGLAVASSATPIASAPKGSMSVVSSVGAYSAIVGTTSTIERLQADYTWTELGDGYTLPDGDYWSFARFGDNLHLTNRVNGILSYDVDAAGAIVPVADAPKARSIFSAFNSLFALDCDGENRLMRNSAIGNSTIWTGKGAATQSFPDGEELMCGVELNGDFAIVFQRNAIRGLYRRNDGKLYDARLLYSGRGCVNPRAMCTIDSRAFFVDSDGFYMITADGALTPIGKDKVSKSFIKRLYGDGLDTVESTVDKDNSRVVFRYRDNSVNSDTVFQHALAYDYEMGEWSEIEVATMAIFTVAAPAMTLETIDAIFGPADNIDIPVDSRAFFGGEPRLAGIDVNGRFGFFDGAPLAAISESGSKMSLRSGTISSVTPVTDASNVKVMVGYRDRLADNITWKAAVAMQASGRAPIYARGKIFTFRLLVDGGDSWSTIRGYDGFDIKESGPI